MSQFGTGWAGPLGTGALGLGAPGSQGSQSFADPFADMASISMPETIAYVLRWCEYIVLSNGSYREALNRVLSYFITDVEISDAGDDEREKWRTFLDETLDIKNVMAIVGLDAMVYGNSFVSVLPSFKRYLSCPGCGFEAPLRKVYNEPAFQFKWKNYEFHASCPNCKQTGTWKHIDRRMGEDGGFRIKRWNPHELEILHDPLTQENAYIWKIPEDYRKQIREGHLYHLERCNWEIVQAVKHNNYLLFDKDVIFHMREEPLAGIRARGWGISRVMTNFRQAWMVQVIHRYNEAICMDYIIPFRVITPAPGDKSTGSDPLLNQDLGGFMGQVMNMVRRRSRDPAAWHTLPYPVQYQALGGDATQLAPKELLEQAQDTLLNAVGIPAEMYKGSMALQAAPMALRLFESSWSALPHNLNSFLRFVVKQICQLLNWEKVTAKLKRVTHADDVQRQIAALQLMTGGQVSQTTGLASIGLDFREEVQRMMADQKYQAEQQAKLQEEMEQSSQMAQMAQPAPQGGAGGAPGGPGGGQPGQAAPGGGGGGGGDPGANAAMGAQQSVVSQLPTGPNQQITPEELQQRSQYVASQIMGMSESQKDSELIKLKRVDPTLHSLVKSQIEDMRQQAKTQGGAMMIAQTYGKQGSAPLPPPNKRTLVI